MKKRKDLYRKERREKRKNIISRDIKLFGLSNQSYELWTGKITAEMFVEALSKSNDMSFDQSPLLLSKSFNECMLLLNQTSTKEN